MDSYNKLFTIVRKTDLLNYDEKEELHLYLMNLKDQVKKQREIIDKAIKYIKENKEKYYQDWGQDDGSCDTYLDENEVLKLLQILEDKGGIK